MLEASTAPSDGDWFTQAQRWRCEALDLKAQLQSVTDTYEERLRELQARLDHETYIRQLITKDAGAGFLAAANKEIERLASVAADAQERSRRSDDRVLGLLSESEEAANLMSEVTVKFDHQADSAASLIRKLHRSDAETAKLQGELEMALRREADKCKQYDCAEATIACIMPRLLDETKTEAKAMKEAQETWLRLIHVESVFDKQATQLNAELQMSHDEHTKLGRKVVERSEHAVFHANAEQHWQRRSEAAEGELVRAGLNQHHLWQAAQRNRAQQCAQQDQIRVMEEQRDRAMYNHVVADKARKELSSWVVASLDEVNRSAHVRTSGAPKSADESFQGHAMVSMLESFRKDQQTRNGYGARVRQPSPMSGRM